MMAIMNPLINAIHVQQDVKHALVILIALLVIPVIHCHQVIVR